MKNPEIVRDQHTLITGGAGLIGLSVAEQVLENGEFVILSDNNIIRLSEVQETLKSKGYQNFDCLKCDITKEEEIRNIFEGANKSKKIIKNVVHCAYPRSKDWGAKFEDLRMDSLSENIANQLGSSIMLSKHTIKHFEENGGGNLIHVSSIQGCNSPKFEHYYGTEMTSPIEYSAIKAGIISITKWLAKKYNGKNIRVNCVSPGGILDNQPEIFIKKYRESCSNIGMLEAKQVATAIYFLMTKNSEAINGQNIIIDDGWSL